MYPEKYDKYVDLLTQPHTPVSVHIQVANHDCFCRCPVCLNYWTDLGLDEDDDEFPYGPFSVDEIEWLKEQRNRLNMAVDMVIPFLRYQRKLMDFKYDQDGLRYELMQIFNESCDKLTIRIFRNVSSDDVIVFVHHGDMAVTVRSNEDVIRFPLFLEMLNELMRDEPETT